MSMLVSSGIKRIVLVGNPNCGKSTLFNLITGMSVHVGNWPGVTVDVKMAQWKVNGEIWEVVDLPGSYSLLGKTLTNKSPVVFCYHKNTMSS